MKKGSIKARIVLWFAGSMMAIAFLGLAYLISFTGQLSQKQLRESLKDVVKETVSLAQFRSGELEEEKLDYYKNGVSIFLYDKKGRLLAPRGGQGIQIDAVLENDTVKRVKNAGEQWLVYDLYSIWEDSGFWVRGVILESGTMANLKRTILAALISLPLLLAASLVGGWLITKKAFAAVGEIADTAGAITSGQDLSLRIPEDGGKDELSHIKHTMNSMLERLQQSFEAEKQFVSDVSHELRTPTAVIISQCEYALSNQEESQWKDGLVSSLAQAKRISSIISQMLLMARAENGKWKPQMETLDLSMLCDTIGEEFEEKAQDAGIQFLAQITPGIQIQGDEVLLIQMLTNLLTNGILYNRVGGNLMLVLDQEAQACRIEICDTGIGMKAEELGKIWNRFYRADTSRSSQGTGLGLPMVKWVVSIHEGTVQVESVVGQGTKFIIKLPSF